MLTKLFMSGLSWRGKTAIAAAAFGALMLFIGTEHQERASECHETPQELSCAELAQHGPGENYHVALTDYKPCMEGYCYYLDDLGLEVREIQIPIYPAEAAEEPPSEDLRIILRVWNAESEEELFQRLAEPKLTGVVWRQGGTSRDEEDMLDDFYPNMPFDQCWVVNIGGTVPNAGDSHRLIGFGAFLAVCGGVVLITETIRYWRRKSQSRATADAPPAPPQLTPVG